MWLFVAAAGFPPSAVRAAVMCTVLQAALASASEYVGMNALATAAFGMLLWNPNWLGDISFQLSFLAVAGILAWGVPLCRRCRTRWKGLNVVIDAYLIGLAATLATAPLVSHTFGVVPLAGLAVNPPAIALAGVVVFGGALWMLAPVGVLAPAFGFVTGTAAEGIGGPHIGADMIWPMSLIMRALTSDDDAEIKRCVETLVNTDGGTGFMHESFHKDDPSNFTRPWFAWANTLFGELILRLADEGKTDLLNSIEVR